MRKGSKGKAQVDESAARREPEFESHNFSEDSLEAGIASVFAAIHEAGFDELANDDEDHEDATLSLLAELNRIWAQPLGAS
jgi:hypothetical protein